MVLHILIKFVIFQVFYKGYHGDCCETFIIGDADEAGQHLVDAARKCRDEAIAICGPGVPFAAIGNNGIYFGIFFIMY